MFWMVTEPLISRIFKERKCKVMNLKFYGIKYG